jgi:hypothetical protein
MVQVKPVKGGLRKISISVIDPALNEIICGHCKQVSDGYYWSAETDMLGNNFGCCPLCYKETLLVNDDENVRGE